MALHHGSINTDRSQPISVHVLDQTPSLTLQYLCDSAVTTVLYHGMSKESHELIHHVKKTVVEIKFSD